MPADKLALAARVRHEARQAHLDRLGFEDYTDYLRSPHWRSVRARFRASDRSQTCICGADGVLLHHKTYERLGAEELDDLIALCGACHEMVHALLARGELVDYGALRDWERAHQYAEQTLAMRRRADAEAPESLEVRVARHRKERSRARRQRSRRKADVSTQLRDAGFDVPEKRAPKGAS